VFKDRLATKNQKKIKIVSKIGHFREHFETCRAQSKGMNNENALNSLRTIDIEGLCALLNLGRSATYLLTKDSSFPQAYGITARHYLWDLSEVEQWITSRKGMKPRVRGTHKTPKRVYFLEGIRVERADA
jgi:predicted DNA-binding transcriptional regulator AlpA